MAAQRPLLTLAVAATAVIVAGSAPLASPAWSARGCSGSWTVVEGPPVRNGELVAVAPRASDDVWAVGAIPSSFASSRLPRRPLIEHWNGTRWTVVSSPPVRGALLGVAAAGPDDAWAVGWSEQPAALVEHWDGSSWRRLALPWSLTLTAVAATSTSDAWAVGSNAAGAMVLHWDGTRWSRVVRRQKAELMDVIALAPTDVWAVGNQGEAKLLALHWDGVRWRAFVIAPAPGHDLPITLEAVAAFASDDVWAVGHAHPEELQGYDADAVLLHWNGRSWRPARPPQPDVGLSAVAAGPAQELWVAGVNIFSFATDDGAGSFLAGRAAAWRTITLNRQLVESIASDPSGALWAVGLVGSGIDELNGFPVRTQPLVERYAC